MLVVAVFQNYHGLNGENKSVFNVVNGKAGNGWELRPHQNGHTTSIVLKVVATRQYSDKHDNM